MATKNTSARNQKALLTGLPEDVSVDRIEQHAHSIELFVSWKEPGIGERFCTRCGGNHCVKKDSGTVQTVRHLPVGLRGTLITFHKPRFLCRECGKTFYLKPSWLIKDISITYPLLLDIYVRLTSTTHSVTDIARDTHTSPAIVQNVIGHFEMPHPKTLPETLGIDEFLGRTGSYNPLKRRYDTEKYHCVITAPDDGAVTGILYRATYGELLPYFRAFPLYEQQKVRFFCTDMRSGFSKVARQCFPNAKICIDPFHVTKLLTEALSTIRVDEWRRLRGEALLFRSEASGAMADGNGALHDSLLMKSKVLEESASLVKASQRLLSTSPYNENLYWNQNPDRREGRLSQIFSVSPLLKDAYDALHSFYDVTGCGSFQSRHSALTGWLDEYLACECPPIRQAAYSIRYHRRGIENAWRYHKSNGPTEGLNKKIKDVKRMAFGSHDFENFRKRAMPACGGTAIDRGSYTVFGEKKSSGTKLPE